MPLVSLSLLHVYPQDLACIIMICLAYDLSSIYDISSIREGTSHVGSGTKLESIPEVIISENIYSVGVFLVKKRVNVLQTYYSIYSPFRL